MPVVDMSTDHSAAEINGTIRFYQVGNQVTVSGFEESDISIQGARLGNFSGDGFGGYEITISSDRPGIPISLSISEQAATGTDGTTLTGATSTRFHQSPTVTAQDNLVLWYNFEGNDSKSGFTIYIPQTNRCQIKTRRTSARKILAVLQVSSWIIVVISEMIFPSINPSFHYGRKS